MRLKKKTNTLKWKCSNKILTYTLIPIAPDNAAYLVLTVHSFFHEESEIFTINKSSEISQEISVFILKPGQHAPFIWTLN